VVRHGKHGYTSLYTSASSRTTGQRTHKNVALMGNALAFLSSHLAAEAMFRNPTA
jgi:hypothetical protein